VGKKKKKKKKKKKTLNEMWVCCVIFFLPIMAKTPENASKQNGTNGGEEKTDNIVQRVTPIRAMLFPRARHALLPKGL
jgi:hypothetical protein